jgi:hypothetical protein
MKLLHSIEKARLRCFFNFDYYDSLGVAVEVLRYRSNVLLEVQRNIEAITDPAKRFAAIERQVKNIKAIENHTDRLIEERVGLAFIHLTQEIIEIAMIMEKQFPPGEISDLQLAFLHRRGAWYTGVIK